jgi:hypothetical protein
MLISKTTFLQFQMCPKDTWLKVHKPELLHLFKPSQFELHLMEQGNEVEAWARKLFPAGRVITATEDEACLETQRLMAASTDAIFQATFVADGFIAKCDVLVRAGSAWDIYEIKGTNSKKEGTEDRDHISDLAFQAIVLERAGVSVGRLFIIHHNKEYVRQGEIDVEALFTKDDSTEQVEAKRAEIVREMEAAKEYLSCDGEPGTGCECHYKGRSRQCRTFAYSHPEIPEYSVHDIVRIGSSKKKLQYFVDERFYSIDELPDDVELCEAQANQVWVHKSGRPIIDEEKIRSALSEYAYPLYFFDYETYGPAIPVFDGFSPYQRIPFQFSLHVLRGPGQTLEHIEFLQEECSDPTRRVAELLGEYIRPEGSVVVWYAPFERGVNKEIAKRRPGYGPLIERINQQIVDLRDIFFKQHYVHPDFRGSTSIKMVLPVLCPELSYEDLVIREGATASEQWWEMVSGAGGSQKRREIGDALREYCKLDTYAMYAIWRTLYNLTEDAMTETPSHSFERVGYSNL